VVAPGVADVLVDLVGDHEQVALAGDAREDLELAAIEHLPARVRRRADDDRARVRPQRRAERALDERERRRLEREELGLETGEDRRVQVVAVVRLEEQDAVAGIEERVHGAGERAGRADGHHDVGRGIGPEAVLALELRRDRLPQPDVAFGERVRALVLADRGDRALADERRRRQVADPLPEVDAAHALAFARHAPDVGLHEPLEAA
jgi:hypothetical protein